MSIRTVDIVTDSICYTMGGNYLYCAIYKIVYVNVFGTGVNNLEHFYSVCVGNNDNDFQDFRADK